MDNFNRAITQTKLSSTTSIGNLLLRLHCHIILQRALLCIEANHVLRVIPALGQGVKGPQTVAWSLSKRQEIGYQMFVFSQIL